MPISTIGQNGLNAPITLTSPVINTVTSAAATALTLQSAGTTAITVDASQNVGIGTSSPTTLVDLVRSSTSGNDVSMPNIFVRNTSATQGNGSSTFNQANVVLSAGNSTVSGGVRATFDSAGSYGTGMQFYVNSTNPLQFYTNGTERMRIGTDGNVMIGASSFPAFGSGPKLYVQGDGNGISVGYGTATSQYRIMYFNSGDATMYFHNNSNYASLSPAGAWTNASDARLKKNIVDIKYGLDDVIKAQPRSYQMNDIAGDFVGFVAQELQEVIPEVVSGDPEKQFGVDYGSLVAVAFKAIQELKALVDAQAAEIAELKAKVA